MKFTYYISRTKVNVIFDLKPLSGQPRISGSKIAHALNCAGSLFLGQIDSKAAKEGTKKHEYAYQTLRDHFDSKNFGIPKLDDGYEELGFYISHAVDVFEKNKYVGIETSVGMQNDFTNGYLLSGNIDLWYIDKNEHLNVCDLKTGRYSVNPENNIQLLTYAMLIKNMLPDIVIKGIKLKIFQDNEIKTWIVEQEDYSVFKQNLKMLLHSKDFKLVLGTHCGACFSKHDCPLYTKKEVTKIKKAKIVETSTSLLKLDPAKFVEIYVKVKELKKAVKLVEDVMKDREEELSDYIQKVPIRVNKVWKSKSKALKKLGDKLKKDDIVGVSAAIKLFGQEKINGLFTEKTVYTYDIIGDKDDNKLLGGK